jgi:hypothetical protein
MTNLKIWKFEKCLELKFKKVDLKCLSDGNDYVLRLRSQSAKIDNNWQLIVMLYTYIV